MHTDMRVAGVSWERFRIAEKLRGPASDTGTAAAPTNHQTAPPSALVTATMFPF